MKKNTPTKSYGQSCSVARALDVFGERWTLLLIRELLTGPKRYTDLKTYLAGINAKLLSDRLKQLEAQGVVEKIDLPSPANATAYALTPAGEALEPAIIALAKWGLQFAAAPARKARSFPHWSVLAMKAMFNPERATNLNISCQFLVESTEIYAVIKSGTFLSGLGRIPAPDVIVTCNEAAFAEFDGSVKTVRNLLDSGKIVIEGSRRDFLKFASCLVLKS